MGTYTTILHEGKDIQIKCGYDNLDVYKVGDRVDQRPMRTPGHMKLADDIYDGVVCRSDDVWENRWVVIIGGVVQAVLPFESADQYDDLRKEWNIQEPPRDLWSEEAWQAHEEEERRRQEEYERRCESMDFYGSLDEVDSAPGVFDYD